MVYTFCPSCGAAVPDPAWRFYSSCGGRLSEAPGQNPPAAPAAGPRRNIPAMTARAGLLLLCIVAAVIVQLFILHLAPAPAAMNAGTVPPPSIAPEALNTTGTVTTPAPHSPDLNTDGNWSGAGQPVNTTLTMPAPSRAPAFAGPLNTITTTPPYSSHAPAMGSSPEVPVVDATSLAARVHELVNRARQEHGLSALGTDAKLASIARAHSTDMASHGYFGHVNLDGMDPTARGAAAGYTCRRDYDSYYTYGISENLFATYRYNSVLFTDSREMEFDWKSEEAIAEETVDAWMNSPDHRDNILDPDMGREGIGVAIAKDDLVFITEDFC